MPFFKTNKDIFVAPWEEEAFDKKWFDSPNLVLPKYKEWDYKREMNIEDVQLWEQLCYATGGLALYAAWEPYAEFYLITHEWHLHKSNAWETFYGPGSMKKAYHRARQLGMHVYPKEVWVEDEDMWLYQEPTDKKIISL